MENDGVEITPESKSKSTASCPVLVGVLFGVLIAVLLLLFVRERKFTWERDVRIQAKEDLATFKARLESEIYARVYYTRSVAAYVSLHPDLSNEEFENLAAALVREDPVVNTMTIAPDGVIRDVFPQEGHEEAVGLDLMAHPERRKIVEKTIKTGKTFIAGPVELVEGGTALISYTPVFDKTGLQHEFWGMTDISIRFDRFLDVVGLDSGETAVALRGVDGSGAAGDVFWGAKEHFEDESIQMPVSLPDGQWILGKKLNLGWAPFLRENRPLLFVSGLAALTLFALVVVAVRGFCRIRASRRRLAILNRDKDRLISIISHDVRSPLSAAIGLLSELEAASDRFSADDRESISMTHSSVEDALLLLENLLEWVKSRDAQPFLRKERVALHREVASVLDSFAFAASRKKIRIENRIEGDVWVSFDQRALRTVVRNLVGNGIKFSESGGKIEISVRDSGESRVEVSLSDQGVGMSRQRIAEITSTGNPQPRQGTHAEQGAGLGLTLCRELLEMSGSRLRIESEPGKGTTVRFTLEKSTAAAGSP